jgi:hypothetical protein
MLSLGAESFVILSAIQKYKDLDTHNNSSECETWSLTPREERRLRVFENTVLRNTFGPKRNKITGEWKILQNGEANDLFCSPNIIQVIKWRRMRWAGRVERMGKRRGAYRVLERT